jgi:hypothetical protein
VVLVALVSQPNHYNPNTSRTAISGPRRDTTWGQPIIDALRQPPDGGRDRAPSRSPRTMLMAIDDKQVRQRQRVRDWWGGPGVHQRWYGRAG